MILFFPFFLKVYLLADNMTKTVNFGGQRRTIQTGCGYTATGSVRDCNFKIKLHQKRCAICGGATLPTEFDRQGGAYNGWDGLRGSNRVEGRLTTVSRNGVVFHTMTEANSMEGSFNFIRRTNNLDG